MGDYDCAAALGLKFMLVTTDKSLIIIHVVCLIYKRPTLSSSRIKQGVQCLWSSLMIGTVLRKQLCKLSVNMETCCILDIALALSSCDSGIRHSGWWLWIGDGWSTTLMSTNCFFVSLPSNYINYNHTHLLPSNYTSQQPINTCKQSNKFKIYRNHCTIFFNYFIIK